MNVKQFVKKNKYSILLILFLLTVVVSISASFTLSKYTRTVPVQFLEIELTDKWPILYRGFATEVAKENGMEGVTRIVMGSFNDYKGEEGFEGYPNALSDDDWTAREEKYWVQQESAQNPEGKNLRKGIKLFYRNEVIDGKEERVAYVLAKDSYPVVFPIDSHNMFELVHWNGLWRVPATSIYFQHIDTSIVENMEAMFWSCTELTSLDVSMFDTSKVTNMKQMFGCCSHLKDLKLGGSFDTSKVTDMQYMFSDCWSIGNLDVSCFDTSKVTNMDHMFYNNSAWYNTKLDVSNFDTSQVEDMQYMFASCRSLTTLNVEGLHTTKVKNMQYMFYDCSNVQTLDVSSFDTAAVTNMSNMFADCRSLISLSVSNFITTEVNNMEAMFANCATLKSLDVSSFDTSKVINMERMFAYNENITTLMWNRQKFDTSKVTTMRQMFAGCKSLTSIDLTGFITAEVTNMSGMFRSCNAFTALDVSSFNTSNVTDMYRMFFGCSGLTTLDLSGFDTHNVQNMYRMFKDSSKLVTVYVGNNWSTGALGSGYQVEHVDESTGVSDGKVTVSGSSELFMGCSALKGGNGTAYDSSRIDADRAHVDGGTGDPGYFTYKAASAN